MIIFAKKHFASQKAALFSLLINSAVYIRAGIALVFRFLKLFTRPVIDALLMTGVMFILIPIYEDFKFSGDGKFPHSLFTVNLPVYIFLWIAGLFFTNNYAKPFPKATSLFYGMLLGTISISVVYAFLSEDFRASRALILIGAIANFIILLLVRWVSQLFKYRRINFYNRNAHRIITIGDSSDIKELTGLLQKNTDTFYMTGYAGTRQEEELEEAFLGHFTRLSKILRLYKTEELIFVTEKISWKEVISVMENYRHRYTYKFFNPKAYFALGSNSKNAAGEVFTSSVNYSLNTTETRYNKRFSDIIVSLVIIILSPLLFLWVNRKLNFFSNIFNVLRGRKTWVGFSNTTFNNLPKMRPGILKTTEETDPDRISLSDADYAKNYSSLKDVIIILKNIRLLGS